MKILLIEPFFGGSHKKWAEAYAKYSKHKVQLMTLGGKYWKWRMLGGTVTLAEQYKKLDYRPDLILATDMLDLATFKGLVGPSLANTPIALYFHENQITYPWSPRDQDVDFKRDRHYGFVNFTSALAADFIFFNSKYHKRSFLDALPGFLKAFPDHRNLELVTDITHKSKVLYLGVERPKKLTETFSNQNVSPIIVWNHRWEYDKDPETFFETLFRLKKEGLQFRLIVLGEQYKRSPDIFEQARIVLKEELLHFGYALSQSEYYNYLWKADLLPVTSRQDFFGVSVVEAMFCNCYPLLPNRLAFPEHIPKEYHAKHLYETPEEFYHKLKECLQDVTKIRNATDHAYFVARYDWAILAPYYDNTFLQVINRL